MPSSSAASVTVRVSRLEPARATGRTCMDSLLRDAGGHPRGMNPARSSRFDQRRRDLANAPVRPGGSPPGAGHPQGPMMTSELAALLAALLAHRLRASLCTTLDRILRAYRLDR